MKNAILILALLVLSSCSYNSHLRPENTNRVVNNVFNSRFPSLSLKVDASFKYIGCIDNHNYAEDQESLKGTFLDVTHHVFHDRKNEKTVWLMINKLKNYRGELQIDNIWQGKALDRGSEVHAGKDFTYKISIVLGHIFSDELKVALYDKYKTTLPSSCYIYKTLARTAGPKNQYIIQIVYAEKFIKASKGSSPEGAEALIKEFNKRANKALTFSLSQNR